MRVSGKRTGKIIMIIVFGSDLVCIAKVITTILCLICLEFADHDVAQAERAEKWSQPMSGFIA